MSATVAIVGAAVLVKAALISALVVQHQGAVAYLRKPVDGPMLLECLEQAIANSPSLLPQTRLVAGAH